MSALLSPPVKWLSFSWARSESLPVKLVLRRLTLRSVVCSGSYAPFGLTFQIHTQCIPLQIDAGEYRPPDRLP